MGFKEKFIEARKYILISLSVCIGATGLTGAILAEGSLNIDKVVPTLKYRSEGRFILYSQIFAGFCLFQLGLLGIYNYFKRNKILNFLFTIETLGIMIIFLIIGIRAQTKFGHLEKEISCANLGPLVEVNSVVTKSFDLFCNKDCLCNAEKKWIIEYLIESYTNTTDTPYFATEEEAAAYNAKEAAITSTIDSSGPDKSQDCEVFNTTVGDYEEIAAMLQWIETTYSCSGICKKLPYYIFSDINTNNPPESFCISKIIQAGNDYAKQVIQVTIIVCVILSITLIYMIIYIILVAKGLANVLPVENLQVKKMQALKKRELLGEEDEDSPPMVYTAHQPQQEMNQIDQQPQNASEYAKF